MEKNRILVLIDGFNYYHKLKEYQAKYGVCVKWLNYKSLIKSWLKEDDDFENIEIFYFSAFARWRGKDAVNRHKTYICALKKVDIQLVLGEFKVKRTNRCKNSEKCSNCNHTPEKTKLIRHEEKNSDVNLAVKLIEYTLTDKYDKCFILSSDNDFASAIKRAKEINPNKTIIIQPPPIAKKGEVLKREYMVDNLENCCKTPALLTNFYTIRKHQFPDKFKGLHNPWLV